MGRPAANSSLFLREDATLVRDLTLRTIRVRAETIDEEARSVEAVLATEQPVRVYDYRAGGLIEEVLRVDGAQLPEQMPLLETHDRWSLDSVLGSVRQIRREGDTIVGRLHFADDERADRAWRKVRAGHLTDTSVGYSVGQYQDIPAGKTVTVNGRSYTAGARPLRVSTEWTPRESSLVPIGADSAAKIRGDMAIPDVSRKETSMPERLRKYLESIGLRHDATEEQARAFLAVLDGDRARVSNLLELEASSETGRIAARAALAEMGLDPDTLNRRAADPPPVDPPPAGDGDSDSERTVHQAREAERTRIREIHRIAGSDLTDDQVQRAIDDDWSLDRVRQETLDAVRRGSQPLHTGPGGAPAGHIRGHETDVNVRSLAAGMLIGSGIDPVARRIAMRSSTDDRGTPLTEQDADRGYALRTLSSRDLVRECALIDTGRHYRDPSMAFRTAVSGGTLAYVFGTSVYASLIQGWEEVPDTTAWCDEEDVPNFLTQDDISLEPNATLKMLPRGDTAKHATVSDSKESYKIARYAKQFVIDEQDIIDDRLGAMMRMPAEMGAAARRLRPDLVYALLLANAALADTGALFNATAVTTAGGHANLTTAVLGATGLKAAILAMGKYRAASGAVLNIRPRFLIIPSALQWTAKELLQSTGQAFTAAAAAATPSQYYTLNVLRGEVQTLVVDDRIGAAGVTDPTTETARTGLDTNWFLSAGGSRTVRVAYRQGTGRSPQMRSFVLDKGQWGIGWDINMDIGAKALDYRGLHKSTGAG